MTNISFENNVADGTTQIEKEWVVLGTLKPDVDHPINRLKSISKSMERYRQSTLQIKSSDGKVVGAIRVRNITSDTGIKNIAATKYYSSEGTKECEQEVSDDMYECYRVLASVAGYSNDKVRQTIVSSYNGTEYTLELDHPVKKDNGGNRLVFHKGIKVDIEVTDEVMDVEIANALLSDIMDIEVVIPPGPRSMEHNEIMSRYMKEYFNS